MIQRFLGGHLFHTAEELAVGRKVSARNFENSVTAKSYLARSFFVVGLLVGLGFIFAAPTPTYAAAKTWDGGGGCGSGTNRYASCAGNWNSNTLPVDGDSINFTDTNGSQEFLWDNNTYGTLPTTVASFTTNYYGSTNTLTFQKSLTVTDEYHATSSADNVTINSGVTLTAGYFFITDATVTNNGTIKFTCTYGTTCGGTSHDAAFYGSGALASSASTSIAEYAGTNQPVYNANYYHLKISGTAVNYGFQIASNGQISGSGTLTAGTGTTTFSGSGTINLPNAGFTTLWVGTSGTLTVNQNISVSTSIGAGPFTSGNTITYGGTPTLTMTGGTIAAASVATMNLYNVTIAGAGVTSTGTPNIANAFVVNSGATFSGSMAKTGGSITNNAATSSALTITTLALTSGTITTGSNFDLSTSISGAGNFTASAGTITMTMTSGTAIAAGAGTLTFNSVAIASGATVATGRNFSVAGNWTNSGGTFTPSTYTVTLSGAGGSTQVIAGNTTFYNLTATAAAARTIRFTAGTTTTVTGTWTVTGSASQLITLQSSTTSAWTINPTAASVSYASISYSTNTGVAFCATYSTDGGNNTSWSIGSAASCGATISGTVYSTEGGAGITGTPTVRIKVNGAGTYSTTASSGVFSVSSVVVNSGDVITVYLDTNGGSSAALVTVSDGSNTSSLSLYQNQLVVRYETGSSITNTNLGQYDKDNDSDIHFTSNAGVLTVDSDYELHIWTGKTFAPGGTVTANGDVHIMGTYTAPATTTVAGSFTNAGTFTPGTGTLTLSGTSKQITGTPTSESFYDLTISGTVASTRSFTVSHTMTVNGTFTPGASDVVTLTGATLTGSGTVKVTRTTTIPAFVNQYAYTTPAPTLTNLTVDYSGTSQIVTNLTYSNLIVSGTITTGTQTATVSGLFTVSGTFTPSAGTITLSGTSGTVLTVSGTHAPTGTATTVYSGANAGGNTNVAAATYNNLQVTGADTYDLAGDTTVSGVLTIGGSATLDGKTRTITLSGTSGTPFVKTGTFTPSTSTVVYSGANASSNTNVAAATYNNLQVTGSDTYDVAGDTTVSGVLTIGANATLDAQTYTVTLSGSGTPLVKTGTFTASTSTVTYSGSSPTIAATTYNVLNLSGSGTAVLPSGTLAVLDLNVTTGTVSAASNNPTINVSGNIALSSGVTYTKGSGTTTFSGASKTITDSTASAQDLGVVSISGTYALSSNAKMTSVAGAGALTTNANTLTLTGSGTVLSVTTFTASTGSTVTYTSGSGASVGARTYYNLTINGTGTFAAAGAIIVNNDLTVTSGTLAMDTSNLQVGLSSISSSGSVKVAASQSLTQSASGTTTILSSSAGANCIGSNGSNCSGTAGTITLGGLSIGDGVSGNFTTTLAGDVTIAGVLTIASTNTLDGSTRTITLSDTSGTPFVKTGTFTPSTSTVVYSGANAGGNTNVAAATYNNVQVTGSDTYDVAGDTTVSGVLTIGASATLDGSTRTITLSGTSGTPLVKTGTFTPSTSTVVYSGANASGNTNVAAATYNNLQVTGSDTYDVAGDTTVSGVLTIGASATLDGSTRTITLSGTSGTPLVKTGTFTPSTSTVVFTGDNGGGTTTIPTATYYNLTVNNASETYALGSGSPVVNNDLTITAGTLDLDASDPSLSVKGDVVIAGTLLGSASSPLNVDGDWTNNGTFTHSNGTVAFTNSAGLLETSNIGGSNGTNFYSLSVTANGKYLRFAAAKTFGVAGVLTITGGQAIPDNIRIFSSTVGAGSSSDQWLLNLTGSSNVLFAIVQNAGCAPGSSSVASHSTNTNAGNNSACWPFGVPGAPDVTGGRFDQPGGGTATTGGTSLSGGISGGGGGGGAPSPDRLDEPGGGAPTTGGTDQGSGGGAPAP
ncbi:MAG: hypothetical protein WC052_00240 [Patescibacteria group bacterium]